jgi:hypothetical protein
MAKEPLFTRRDFLILALAGVGAATTTVLTGCGPNGGRLSNKEINLSITV